MCSFECIIELASEMLRSIEGIFADGIVIRYRGMSGKAGDCMQTRQKVNYQRVLEDTIARQQKEGKVPKLLLHSCCAPCSSYVLEYLSQYFEITVLYYNPNIFPDTGAWANNGGMLVITAWWGVWHIISGLTLAFVWRLRGRKEAGEE